MTGVVARWQPKCRVDVLQKRLSAATRVLASATVKFTDAQSSPTLPNHFVLGLLLYEIPQYCHTRPVK